MVGVKGRSGRKRKPTQILRFQGTLRPHRRPANEPQPNSGQSERAKPPQRPAWVTGEARKEWERLEGKLNGAGLLTTWDRSLFVAYCVTWKEYVACQRKLKSLDDYTIETKKGNVIQHPLVGIRNQAYKRLLQLCGEFGLSPSARAHLDVDITDPAVGTDPLDELISRRLSRSN